MAATPEGTSWVSGRIRNRGWELKRILWTRTRRGGGPGAIFAIASFIRRPSVLVVDGRVRGPLAPPSSHRGRFVRFIYRRRMESRLKCRGRPGCTHEGMALLGLDPSLFRRTPRWCGPLVAMSVWRRWISGATGSPAGFMRLAFRNYISSK